jgi:hypothetical protein
MSAPATNLYFARAHCAVAQVIFQKYSPDQQSMRLTLEIARHL